MSVRMSVIDILTDIPQDDDYGTAYDPSLGYCSRGFGMAVSAPSVAGDTVSFQVDAEIRWGPAGEDDEGVVAFRLDPVRVH